MASRLLTRSFADCIRRRYGCRWLIQTPFVSSVIWCSKGSCDCRSCLSPPTCREVATPSDALCLCSDQGHIGLDPKSIPSCLAGDSLCLRFVGVVPWAVPTQPNCWLLTHRERDKQAQPILPCLQNPIFVTGSTVTCLLRTVPNKLLCQAALRCKKAKAIFRHSSFGRTGSCPWSVISSFPVRL